MKASEEEHGDVVEPLEETLTLAEAAPGGFLETGDSPRVESDRGGGGLSGEDSSLTVEMRSSMGRAGSRRRALVRNFKARVRSPASRACFPIFRHFSASSLFPSIALLRRRAEKKKNPRKIRKGGQKRGKIRSLKSNPNEKEKKN